MNYELAKELKDVGFKCNTNYPSRHGWTDGVPDYFDYDRGWNYHGLHVFKPTLSELIEACGDEIESLIHDIGAQEWVATQFQAFGGKPTLHARGKTPEEAVARLYLALNQK